MQIADYFERSVTRPIPPVVYFGAQDPEDLTKEVEEYIITGGYPPGDPRATTEGIHEQFVRLLDNMRTELGRHGGPELTASWVSGFYGSGKSSFAKLLGLALDGRRLASGKPLPEALLAQDRSPAAADFRKAWKLFTADLDALAVVFDVGAAARENEHIHVVAVREVQKRLGYCSTSGLVAEYELKLEAEDTFDAFVAKVLEVHGKPWADLCNSQLAEDYFSAALHALRPDLYPDPMAWVNSRSGSAYDSKRAADEAVLAIQRMVNKRAPGRTLFLVVDEVSQYVHDDHDRMLALQSFVEALGQRMRGRAWIIATGQQKLEEGAGQSTAISKLKDRFPAHLRVHLGQSNIREVVHQRLLRKKRVLEDGLKELFHAHRPDLALYGYQGDQISEGDFVEIYPLLPGHIDLLLRITSGLRARGTRVQGDAQQIRGLLQLLGDIFRGPDLVTREPGWLLTVDRVYDVLHTALDADLHMTLGQAMDFCKRQNNETMKRVVKAVAMLELLQDEKHPTTADLVSRCLYDRLGAPNPLPEVQKALDALVGEGLLGHSNQTGYKIESSAGQEWQRERDGYVPSTEQLSEQVQKVLTEVVGSTEKVSVGKLPLSWLAFFSDDSGTRDKRLHDEKKPTAITLDFQLTRAQGADEWIPRSATGALKERIVWVVGDQDALVHAARKLIRSHRMVDRYGSRQTNDPDRQRLLIQERNDEDTARRELGDAVRAAFMAGRIYFSGEQIAPRDEGAALPAALGRVAERIARRLYPDPAAYTVSEKDVLFLIESADLAAPPPVFGEEQLGLLALDAGRYEVTCKGRVPQEILKQLRAEGALTGSTLIARLGGPPHGVPPDVTRAAVVGLLRGGKVRIDIGGIVITSVRDEGARELLKDGGLRKAHITENTQETLTPRDRNAICALFKDHLKKDVAREPDAIADAVAETFPGVRARLTSVGERFRRLPSRTPYPEALRKLEEVLEACRKDRSVEPTVLAVKRSLPQLRDGIDLLRRIESELGDDAVKSVALADAVHTYEWPGLSAIGPSEAAREAARSIEAQLASARPWESAAELAASAEVLRGEYRERRRSLIGRHDEELDVAIERVKRREGFERLDPDQRHKVLQHLREGGAAGTDDRAIAPPLEALEAQLGARRDAAERKAVLELDDLRTGLGDRPVVEVALDLAGREVDGEPELERLLDDLRVRVVKGLAGGKHRVRLKG